MTGWVVNPANDFVFYRANMIIHADAVTWAKEYDGDKFHSLLCDPPYELAFMGRDWDKTGVAFDPETWEAFMNVLHPGAFGMAFASSRGWHRLAVAIEDAGFVIHPSIFGWSFGSGFPKATNISKQIDGSYGQQAKGFNTAGGKENYDGQDKSFRSDYGYEYETEDPLAKAWEGHRYGLQALKPALEPIIVFQKPYEGRPIDNITDTGAGALNIDGGRIGSEEIKINTYSDRGFQWGVGTSGNGAPYSGETHKGRWPANFILLDEEAARRLDAQSGDRPSGGRKAGQSWIRTGDITGFGGEYAKDNGGVVQRDYISDSGGASRFFYNVQHQLDEADPVLYQAKASRKERDAGLDGMPPKEREWADDRTGGRGTGYKERVGGSGKPLNGTGELGKSRNVHPTVKPIDLTRYLATLLLPPKEYAPRRIFVPFAGVASEMIGAELAGWDEVVGVEITEEYIPIAEARIEHWTNLEIKSKQVDANWNDLPMFKESE